MPKLDTNTLIANSVLLNSDGHPWVLVNNEIHPLNGVHLRMHF